MPLRREARGSSEGAPSTRRPVHGHPSAGGALRPSDAFPRGRGPEGTVAAAESLPRPQEPQLRWAQLSRGGSLALRPAGAAGDLALGRGAFPGTADPRAGRTLHRRWWPWALASETVAWEAAPAPPPACWMNLGSAGLGAWVSSSGKTSAALSLASASAQRPAQRPAQPRGPRVLGLWF